MRSRGRPAISTVTLVLALLAASYVAPAVQGHAASPIYFFRLAGVRQEPRVRPSDIVFAADGNWNVTGLHWRGWGTGVARSDGTSHVNDCVPNCAQGTVTPVPAHVTLWSPGLYRGREIYLCYRLYYTVNTSAPDERGCNAATVYVACQITSLPVPGDRALSIEIGDAELAAIYRQDPASWRSRSAASCELANRIASEAYAAIRNSSYATPASLVAEGTGWYAGRFTCAHTTGPGEHPYTYWACTHSGVQGVTAVGFQSGPAN
jgi:hypothetical protein